MRKRHAAKATKTALARKGRRAPVAVRAPHGTLFLARMPIERERKNVSTQNSLMQEGRVWRRTNTAASAGSGQQGPTKKGSMRTIETKRKPKTRHLDEAKVRLKNSLWGQRMQP